MLRWILLASAGLALAGYAAVAVVAARKLTSAVRRMPPADPLAAGLAYEDIRIAARGDAITIAAWHIPAERPAGAVIIAHGIGGCRGREFTVSSLELVGRLVASGLSVLMIDLRGHGASDAAPMTYGSAERRDVLGAADWLLGQGHAPGRIGVLGLSMGGVAGIGAMDLEPAIGALVVDSSCADFMLMMRSHFRRFSGLPQAFLPGTMLMARLLTGENLARLRPAEQLRHIPRRPTLIIHAKGDRLVPLAHAQALAAAADAELWVVRTAVHLGSLAADSDAYAQRVVGFFSAALAAQEPGEDEGAARAVGGMDAALGVV